MGDNSSEFRILRVWSFATGESYDFDFEDFSNTTNILNDEDMGTTDRPNSADQEDLGTVDDAPSIPSPTTPPPPPPPRMFQRRRTTISRERREMSPVIEEDEPAEETGHGNAQQAGDNANPTTPSASARLPERSPLRDGNNRENINNGNPPVQAQEMEEDDEEEIDLSDDDIEDMDVLDFHTFYIERFYRRYRHERIQNKENSNF